MARSCTWTLLHDGEVIARFDPDLRRSDFPWMRGPLRERTAMFDRLAEQDVIDETTCELLDDEGERMPMFAVRRHGDTVAWRWGDAED